MPQQNFDYHPAGGRSVSSISVSIFADDPQTRQHMCEDAELAGLSPNSRGPLCDALHAGDAAFDDLVFLHVASLSAVDCGALLALDARLASRDARVVVSVDPATLEDVFGCTAHSRPQILVAPGRAERVTALATAMAHRAANRVRESEGIERADLRLLTEQVARLAARIDELASGDERVFRLASPSDGYAGSGEGERRLIRSPRPALPDPRLVRLIIRQRQARAQFFDGELFADPAWDILLDLTAARAEHARVSVTSLCIASGVPPTTALRWIGQMVDAGLLDRVEDESDKRRAFIQLSDKAADAMARYFVQLGKDARGLV